MERDLVGYADKPPRVTWPNGARVVISLVVNYEEGAENLLQDGIGRRESWGDAMSPVPADRRDLANESMLEYGSRVGVWRFFRIFAKYRVPPRSSRVRSRSSGTPPSAAPSRSRVTTSAAMATAGKSIT
jgi:hypothetical protein